MGLPKEIIAFKDKYGVDADEIWEVRGGAYAIKHKALERVALAENIKFDPPQILSINLADKTIAMCVTGRQGDRTEWTTGEAAPYNNKNGYPVAMAEKRARDRVILKLLQAHGALYSEDEADEFKEGRRNPHVTRPEDIAEPTEFDQHGNPVDNIPLGDIAIEPLPKSKAKTDWALCQSEIVRCSTAAGLLKWGNDNANRVASFPSDWQEILRGVYREQMDKLRQGRAA
jgi:hypothetical protein